MFGLPGNPVSSMVSFELIARPALRLMMGHDHAGADRPRIVAVADAGLARRPDDKTHLVRVYGSFATDGRLHVRSTGPQGSHQLAATAQAVAITAGASASAGSTGSAVGASGGKKDATTRGAYHKGMAVFTVAKGGLMYEASVAGQKFSYKPKG